MEFNENQKKVISGFVSGTLGAGLLYPLEVARVKTLFSSSLLRKNLKRANFTNGIGFNILTSGCKVTVCYGGQEFIKERFLEYGFNRKQSQIYSSSLTGVVVSLAMNPVNTIKVGLQAPEHNHHNWLQVSRNIYNNYGYKGFYRGGLGLLVRDIVWTSVYFPMFTFTNYHLNNYFGFGKDDNPKPKTTFLSSGISALASVIVAYPFDNIRLYRQHHDIDFKHLSSIKKAFAKNKSNFISFLIGSSRATISIIISHTSYLYIKGLL